MADDQVYIATQSRVFHRDGSRVIVKAGRSRAHGGSWIVRDHPDLWKPIDVHFGVVEATAVPGEKRGTPTCDECGFEAKTVAGLGAHKRSHD